MYVLSVHFISHLPFATAGLSGFALFVSVSGIFLSAFMMFVPVVYDKYDKLATLAIALKEIRVAFILTGVGSTFSLLIAFVISATISRLSIADLMATQIRDNHLRMDGGRL